MNLANLKQGLATAFSEAVTQLGIRELDEREDPYGAQVTLGNQLAAVRVRRDYLDNRFFVTIHRLDRGPIAPLRDMIERKRDPLNGFDLDDLIALRAPDHHVDQNQWSERETLSRYAEALPLVAHDIFEGDYKAFDQLTRIVAGRIEQGMRDGQAVGPDSSAFLKAAQNAQLI